MTSGSPFVPAGSRQSFLETTGNGEILRRLNDGLGAREPFLLLTGEAGTGKTALAAEAVARWGPRVAAAFVAYPALTGEEMLEEILRRFGAEPPAGAGRPALLACLERALDETTRDGQVALLVVDDAHGLSRERLEELRLLVNAAQLARRPLEVMLIGLPALDRLLDDPALAALRQRVSVRAKLGTLTAADTERYLHHRVAAAGGDGPGLFPRKTCRDIASRTGGVPRRISVLAGEALRVAQAWGDAAVGGEHVQTAAAALGGFAPAGNRAGAADEAAEESAASVPAAPRPAIVAATPGPAIVAPAPGPAHVVARAPRVEPAEAPLPPPPANHDPREWVARFVGDQGPVQIASRSLAESNWSPEPAEPADAESPDATGALPAPPRRRERSRPRSRSRHAGGVRLGVIALLVLIVVAAGVALLMKGHGAARNRARQAAAVPSRASTPRESTIVRPAAVSPAVASTPARAKSSAPPHREESPRSDASTSRSRRPHTLEVARDLDLYDALDQRDRMQALTGFEGWVVPAAEGDGARYRVVLGAYRSHERATAAADMLLRSRTLPNVTVVELPPRSVRQ